MVSPQRHPRPREDDEPWYRQFWPWFLIALPGSVVIAGLSTVYIANRHADDLVVDDYYKDGLAINRQIERRQNATDLGVDARLLMTEQRVQVRISGDVVQPTLRLFLSHPLEADRDFALTLERVAPGLYDAVLPVAVGENWHWQIDSDVGDWRLDGSLTADNFLRADS